MIGHRTLALLGAFALGPSAVAQAPADCQLCAPETMKADARPTIPLQIEIESALEFSRVAAGGGKTGDVAIDPKSGDRKVSGTIVDLGGNALRGSVKLKGEPGAAVRIDLPVRIELRSSRGHVAEVINLKSDLPPDPHLDQNGELRFHFGGQLIVKGRISGAFRGSIPITADYP